MNYQNKDDISRAAKAVSVIHQKFRRPKSIGDKIFVQITSDFLVISDIGQNLGNLKPFAVKISDFQHFSTKIFSKLYGKFFTNHLKNFLKINLTKSLEIFRNFDFQKKLSHKNAKKVAYLGCFCQKFGDFSVILGKKCGEFCDF